MSKPCVAPFGTWTSPITSGLIVKGTIGLSEPRLLGDVVHWVEMRPAERGRYVVVRHTRDGQTRDLTPAAMNARTRVHEYGGGAYLPTGDAVYFSNFADQRLYRQVGDGAAEPITPESKMRYADAVMDEPRMRLVCVREDHTAGDQSAVNSIVAVSADGSVTAGQVLVAGSDFYSNPCLSPDGKRLAWLSWDHPNMPWDGTELWVAPIADDGSLGSAERIAGGPEESVFQPQWSPDGLLHFVSDRTGWWNLYRHEGGRTEALAPMEAEFGQPAWVFGLSTYAFISPTEILCTYTQRGTWRLARLDLRRRNLTDVPNVPYTQIGWVRADRKHAVFVAGSPTDASSVVRMDLATNRCDVLRRSSSVKTDKGYLSVPEPLEFPTENNLTAHALFYPPANRDFASPPEERPPLLVHIHGGPTSSASSTLNLSTQFWTSRGIAVLDVNYGGSTGYGREYRKRLGNNWGVVDVDDCVNGARFLVRAGRVDGNRLAIAGGSAGGYTTLAVLTFRDVFKAGASHYGVSDLEALVLDTHKFESRYLDRLVGPYPERTDLYTARSPIRHVDRLSSPTIFFQGLEDRIVPPNQAERMVEALRKKGVPVAYLAFQGEQHGFRQAANIKRSLDAELYFYGRVFGFEPADKIEPVEIANL